MKRWEGGLGYFKYHPWEIFPNKAAAIFPNVGLKIVLFSDLIIWLLFVSVLLKIYQEYWEISIVYFSPFYQALRNIKQNIGREK